LNVGLDVGFCPGIRIGSTLRHNGVKPVSRTSRLVLKTSNAVVLWLIKEITVSILASFTTLMLSNTTQRWSVWTTAAFYKLTHGSSQWAF